MRCVMAVYLRRNSFSEAVEVSSTPSVFLAPPPPTQKKSIQSAKRAQVILAGY